jgi:phosphoenolpyruvate-protein phosphotransferase
MSSIVKGVAASSGVAVGPIHVHRETTVELPSGTVDDVEAELARLEGAVAVVDLKLSRLQEQAVASAGAETAEIFGVHRMFLEDSSLIDPIRERIETKAMSAERAVDEGARELADEFAELGDEYFAQRAVDIRDIGQQVVRALLGIEHGGLAEVDVPSIIVAHDLTPSETVSLPPGMALGFCTDVGSAVSHTAILARSMGVPAIVGVGHIDVTGGELAVLDGDAGTIVIDPDDETVAEARERLRVRTEVLAEAQVRAHEPATTTDGHTVEVVANVGSVDDAVRASVSGAEGIGLLRTEFLFLERDRLPDEDEQAEAYRDIFENFPDGRVVVRTLDVGGDKQLPSVALADELNPFLGKRGVRLTLAEEGLFMTQLRAVLRGGAGRRVSIMFPMVGSPAEVTAVREFVDRAAASLDADGIERATELELGIMIEVPSAAVLADVLAPDVDFFSIGTNDLTQYTLAVDRTNPAVAHLADALHPGVLRLIAGVISAAHEHGRWVGLCGELAGDALAAPLLLGLGLDEFSMSAPSVPVVKKRIRELSTDSCREIALRCLAVGSPEEVHEILAGA